MLTDGTFEYRRIQRSSLIFPDPGNVVPSGT